MKELRSILGFVIFFGGLYFLDGYLQEPSVGEFLGSNLKYTPEQQALFLSFLKEEDIPYRRDSTGYLHYHLTGHAKVRAFGRELYGSPDYDSVMAIDSQMETLLRKGFEQAGVPYTVRMVGNPPTINISFEAKYNPQVDLIDQKAWMDWAKRLKKTNEAIVGYPE